MTKDQDLFSASKKAHPDVNGSAEQVYAPPSIGYHKYIIDGIRAGHFCCLSAVDGNGEWVNVIYPHVHSDLLGNDIAIVGNCSNQKGEKRLLKIPISSLLHFPIIGIRDHLPIDPEVTTPLTENHLQDGEFQGQTGVFLGYLPQWIPKYFGSTILEGDARSSESESVLASDGPAYEVWHHNMVKYLNTDVNEFVLSLVDDIAKAGEAQIYIKPDSSKIMLSQSGPAVIPSFAKAADFPQIDAKISKFFLSTSTFETTTPPAPSQAAINANPVQVVVKSPQDEEKEAIALKGQAKFALLNCGGHWDFDKGVVEALTYPTFSKQIDDIFKMPRASRAVELASYLERAHRSAKNGDPTSMYSTHSSILVVQKPWAASLLLGNYRTEPLDSLYGSADSIDPTMYLAQSNKALAQRVILAEQRSRNESNMDVPESRVSAPKTMIERIGECRSVDDFLKMMVNVMNQFTAFVNVPEMSAAGTPHLLHQLCHSFIFLCGKDFRNWVERTGGGKYVHCTLLQFWDSCHSNFCTFATDFQNSNYYYTKRPVEELESEYLTKVAVCFQAARSHFRKHICMNTVDHSYPAITYLASSPSSKNDSVSTQPTDNPAPASNREHAKGTADDTPNPPSTDKDRSSDWDDSGPKRKKRRGNRGDSGVRDNPKNRGLFFVSDINAPNPLGTVTDASPHFCCMGMEVQRDETGRVTLKGAKYWSPYKMPEKQLHIIGDYFLQTRKGWFNVVPFKGYPLKDKYRCLLGNHKGPFNRG